ncbi:MAG: hypothetical protein ABI823_00735 [Bryobacteraceae bacterium]
MGEILRPIVPRRTMAAEDRPLPAAWRDFIRYCRELGHGEIDQLKIQDGVPVLAEITRKKVRFGPD